MLGAYNFTQHATRGFFPYTLTVVRKKRYRLRTSTPKLPRSHELPHEFAMLPIPTYPQDLAQPEVCLNLPLSMRLTTRSRTYRFRTVSCSCFLTMGPRSPSSQLSASDFTPAQSLVGKSAPLLTNLSLVPATTQFDRTRPRNRMFQLLVLHHLYWMVIPNRLPSSQPLLFSKHQQGE